MVLAKTGLVRSATILWLCGLCTSAFAAKAPELPASAKKLSAAEIVSLYDGKSFSFTTYTAFGVATGTVTYDFKTKTNSGNYQLGFRKGDIDGKIRLDGDRFCYKVRLDSEHRDFVHPPATTSTTSIRAARFAA
jgi:hypothetical protein